MRGGARAQAKEEALPAHGMLEGYLHGESERDLESPARPRELRHGCRAVKALLVGAVAFLFLALVFRALVNIVLFFVA